MSGTDELPSWFGAALVAPVEHGTTVVEGATIAYRAWGELSSPGVVLVHGGAAHSRWWDHIAPLLTERRRRIVALDLSGHGDSDHRSEYSFETWAREVVAVARAAGTLAGAVVVGHSMGGFVALRAASLPGTGLSGAIAIDPPIHDPAPEEDPANAARMARPPRIYESAEQALARFHPLPDQPVLPYVLAHVGQHSIRRAGGGWTWKYDPHILGHTPLTPALVTAAQCRVALLRAQSGMLSERVSRMVTGRLGPEVPVIDLPETGHHAMLDQPLALVAALRVLLSTWATEIGLGAAPDPAPRPR